MDAQGGNSAPRLPGAWRHGLAVGPEDVDRLGERLDVPAAVGDGQLDDVAAALAVAVLDTRSHGARAVAEIPDVVGLGDDQRRCGRRSVEGHHVAGVDRARDHKGGTEQCGGRAAEERVGIALDRAGVIPLAPKYVGVVPDGHRVGLRTAHQATLVVVDLGPVQREPPVQPGIHD